METQQSTGDTDVVIPQAISSSNSDTETKEEKTDNTQDCQQIGNIKQEDFSENEPIQMFTSDRLSTEATEPNLNVNTPSVDTVKSEKETFSSGTRIDTGVTESGHLESASRLDESHTPSPSEKPTESNARRGSRIRHKVEKVTGVGDVDVDQSGVPETRESVKERVSRSEVSRRRRTPRGLKTEDLVDLQVQFVTPTCNSAVSAPASGCTAATTRTRHKRKCSEMRTARKKQNDVTAGQENGSNSTSATLQVDISGAVAEEWRHIGTQRGLSTDTEIANFLIKHYRDTGGRQCTTCQSPLRLLCCKCPLPPPSPPNSNTSMTTLPLSEPLSLSPSQEPPADVSEEAEDVPLESLSSHATQIPKLLPRKHWKRNSGRKPHVCTECGSQFARSGGLKVHMRIHTGERPYVCSECGQGFSQSGQLTIHMRKHKGERPFVCTTCSASFPLAGSLKQHMRIHTGDRPYSCPHCSRHFSYAGDLTVHVRKHTGDRPFLCSDCGKSFAVSSDLSKHKKIHSDHRPFKCSVCHKGFPFLNRLTLHMRTHTGDKPFLCSDCGSSFSRASNLTVHRRVHHTFEKPFVCPFCQHAFADSANLSKHKKNKHGKHKAEPQPTSALNVSDKCSNEVLISPVNNGVGNGEAGNITGVTDQLAAAEVGSGQLEMRGGGDGGSQMMGMGSVFPFYNYYYHQQHAGQQF